MKVVCVNDEPQSQVAGLPHAMPRLLKGAIYTVIEVHHLNRRDYYALAEMPKNTYGGLHFFDSYLFVPLDYWKDEFNVNEDIDEPVKPVVRPALVAA